jgi:hypothetical protein
MEFITSSDFSIFIISLEQITNFVSSFMAFNDEQYQNYVFYCQGGYVWAIKLSPCRLISYDEIVLCIFIFEKDENCLRRRTWNERKEKKKFFAINQKRVRKGL